ncbi:MAG TPA: hypothetical protein VFO05_02935 [Candidatus Limnocylindrales bacterium]|nr:hypothetical protein [Candidatus Limnocylindrales bacterium]
MDEHPVDKPDRGPVDPAARRAVWSRRAAVGILVAFAMFVLFNLVTVLVLAYRSVVEGQGGPFP